MALIGATTLAFAQKKVVRSAEKNFKSGDLTAAMTDITAASSDPETGSDPGTYLLKAQIETKKFGSDSSNSATTLKLGKAALATYHKAFEMAGSDKNTGVGKDVYGDDMPGVPDNLRPYSIYTLKNVAFDKGGERFNADDLEMAYEFFNLAGEVDHTDTTVHYNAGYIAQEIGKFDEAKKHYGYLLDVEEYNKLTVYYLMVQILSGEDAEPEAAYDVIMAGREDYPEDKVLAEYEIQLLLQLNKMDEAMASIQEALKNDPNNPGILLRSGYLKEQAGDIDGALVDYKKSVEADPEFYDGNYYAGALLLEKSREIIVAIGGLSDADWEVKAKPMTDEANLYYKQAIPYFEKAIEIRPDNTDIMAILYQVQTRLKNDAEAEKYNKMLIELKGPNWMDGN
ncbi:tetratricopeptide repeat protein [Algoriphagus ratkowskyi]|nr:tetratricopeptide repeat protein [Algoriphagus ratkowskyi]